MLPIPVQYARNGDTHIAYQVVGSGSIDILMVPGWTSHLLVEWEEPTFVRFIERLSSFARLIRFDKRGTGLSDRPSGIPTLEERMEDAHAVMDAVGLERAAVFGWSEGGPMSILFAATYPERTTALVLYGTQARFVQAPDYPWGDHPAEIDGAMKLLEEKWGRTVSKALAPSGDERYSAWLLRYQQPPRARLPLRHFSGQTIRSTFEPSFLRFACRLSSSAGATILWVRGRPDVILRSASQARSSSS